MLERVIEEGTAPLNASGQRLDQFVVELFPDFSRARLQGWIRSGELTVDGAIVKPKYKLRGGERLSLNAVLESQGEWLPEDIPIDIVYEDDALLVVNKPANLVVHPAAGNYSGTLLNALLHHHAALAHIPRAGIVHRLDKDTTGLMVVAKTLDAQNQLVQQLQARSVSREYQAIVYGLLEKAGVVDEPIGRDPKNRKKMAVVREGVGKVARTHYAATERLESFTLLRLKLETGRTHQIRVHMSHIQHGLLGDPVYSGKRGFKASIVPQDVLDHISCFPRQALHAARLQLIHPETQEEIYWEAPLPEDFTALLELLRTNASP